MEPELSLLGTESREAPCLSSISVCKCRIEQYIDIRARIHGTSTLGRRELPGGKLASQKMNTVTVSSKKGRP